MTTPDEFEVKLTRRQMFIHNELGKLYAAGGVFLMRADAVDGMLIAQNAEQLSTSAVMVLRHHKKAEKWVADALTSNDYLMFASVYGGILYALLEHHHLMPDIKTVVAKLFSRGKPGEANNQAPVPGNEQTGFSGMATNQLATG